MSETSLQRVHLKPSRSAIDSFVLAPCSNDKNRIQYFLDTYGDAYINERENFTVRTLSSLKETQTTSGGDVDPLHGYTCLILAAKNGRKEIVELLLARGADVEMEVSGGRKAEYFAEEHGHAEIVAMIQKAREDRKIQAAAAARKKAAQSSEERIRSLKQQKHKKIFSV